jgi:hypothetical protein
VLDHRAGLYLDISEMDPRRPGPTTQDSHAHQRATGKNDDNAGLSRNRRRDVVDNDQYAAFTRRIMRAYSRRIAAATSKHSPRW